MINKIETIFLQLLKDVIHGRKTPAELCDDLSEQEAEKLFKLVRIHNVAPLIYDQIGAMGFFSSLDENIRIPFKKHAVQQMFNQTLRTTYFLETYQKLCEQRLEPVIVKGIILRSLYPKADLRPSSDEDLLIDCNSFSATDSFLKNNGYKCITEFDKDIPPEAGYRNFRTGVYLEVHTLLFPENDSIGAFNNEFTESYKYRSREEYEGHVLYTMLPEDHLLYLIAHAAKHFMYSGVGIRQICDITLFTEHYVNQIDVESLKYRLQKMSLLEIAEAFFAVSVEYLGMNSDTLSSFFELSNNNTEEVLKDILEGGLYGKVDSIRTHSANVTVSANTAKGIRAALFPDYPYMAANYSYVKKYPVLLPWAYGERFIHYAAKNRGRLSAPLKKGISRSKLIHKLYTDKSHTDRKAISTDVYMDVVTEGLAAGKEMPVPVVGNSMVPFLVGDRDTVLIHPVDKKLKTGDIVLYRRSNSQYVLHRIIAVKNGKYLIAGDNESIIDKDIYPDQILGYVIKAKRKDIWIDETDPIWRFFAIFWSRTVPLHRPMISAYTKFKIISQSGGSDDED